MSAALVLVLVDLLAVEVAAVLGHRVMSGAPLEVAG